MFYFNVHCTDSVASEGTVVKKAGKVDVSDITEICTLENCTLKAIGACWLEVRHKSASVRRFLLFYGRLDF